MLNFISHHRVDGDLVAASRRFKTLTVEERLELFDQWGEFCLALNPNLPMLKHAEPIPGRVQVFTAPQSKVRRH